MENINTKFINKLIAKIGSESKEVIVPVRIETYATPANCFPNVDEKVKRDGGSIVYGWSVLIGNFLVEAERHAVWKSPDGELIDITPSTSGMSTTLFIEEDLDYTGQYIDNVRINKTNNKIVDDWINVASVRSKILNTAKRNGEHITIPTPMVKLYYSYEDLNNLYFSYLSAGGTEDTKCFCISGKVYKKCHGTIIDINCKKDSEVIDSFLREKEKSKR